MPDTASPEAVTIPTALALRIVALADAWADDDERSGLTPPAYDADACDLLTDLVAEAGQLADALRAAGVEPWPVDPLEACTGTTPECPHTQCPDGWHDGADLPCSCTPDCARGDDDADA